MQKPICILLKGVPGAGKDTVAKELICPNYGFIRYAFADKFKIIVKDLYNLSENQMHGPLKEKIDLRYNKSPRQIFQDFGNGQRAIYENIWIDYVVRGIKKDFELGHSRFVITDLRFIQEYKVTKKELEDIGFKIVSVQINRNTKASKNKKTMSDISETSLDQAGFKADIEIDNSGTINSFLNTFEEKVIKTLLL